MCHSVSHERVDGSWDADWLTLPQPFVPEDRKKVLKHHPDKKAGAAGDSNDDSFFKCIAKGECGMRAVSS